MGADVLLELIDLRFLEEVLRPALASFRESGDPGPLARLAEQAADRLEAIATASDDAWRRDAMGPYVLPARARDAAAALGAPSSAVDAARALKRDALPAILEALALAWDVVSPPREQIVLGGALAASGVYGDLCIGMANGPCLEGSTGESSQLLSSDDLRDLRADLRDAAEDAELHALRRLVDAADGVRYGLVLTVI